MKQEKQVARGALMNQLLSAIATRLPLLLLRLNDKRAKQKVSGVTFNADVQGEMNGVYVSFTNLPEAPFQKQNFQEKEKEREEKKTLEVDYSFSQKFLYEERHVRYKPTLYRPGTQRNGKSGKEKTLGRHVSCNPLYLKSNFFLPNST
jgi:hypothetical protein